jgi:predicted tellurium resistance membrane protein TerC
MISLGIFLGTIISLIIAIFAGGLMNTIPNRHLVGGLILVGIGLMSFVHTNNRWHHKKIHLFRVKKKLKKSRKTNPSNLKFISLGMILFFATGIDDTLAYSELIMASGGWLSISIGVLIATCISLIIANSLSGFLKKIPHPEKIGGSLVILIGILLILKIL